MKPAIETKSNVGTVIATPMKLGIYYWDVEKKAGGKIKCTGSCLKQWPPVYVAGAVPKHVTGVMATFATVKRGMKHQLTVNGLPAYTYSGDKAGVVKCDGVDRLRGEAHVVRNSSRATMGEACGCRVSSTASPNRRTDPPVGADSVDVFSRKSRSMSSRSMPRPPVRAVLSGDHVPGDLHGSTTYTTSSARTWWRR